MGKVSTRKKFERDSPMGPSTSSHVRETVMVKADDVEDVPGWSFHPNDVVGTVNSRPVRIYADGKPGKPENRVITSHSTGY
jgi:hypothetical protein